jgi:hypothetical protein
MIDAYVVGIKLTVDNAIFGELTKLLAEFSKIKTAVGGIDTALGKTGEGMEKVHGHVTRMEAAFSRMKSMASNFSSAVSSLGGIHTAEAAVERVWEPTAEQRRASLQASLAGASPDGIAEMRAAADALAKSRGDQTTTQYMELQGFLYGAVQNAHEVAELSPLFADFQTTMSMDGKGHGVSKEQVVAAVKVLEARHKLYNPDHSINRDAVREELSHMAAGFNLTEGRQKPTDYYAQVQSGGASNMGAMSTEGFYGWGTELGQAMRNTKLGTAVSAMSRQMESGIMTKAVLAQLIRNGWIHARDAQGHQLIHTMGNGRFKFDAGAVDDKAGLDANQYEWLGKHIQSAREYRQAHDPRHAPVSARDVISSSFSSGTSAREAGEIDALIPLLELFSKNMEAYVQTHPIEKTAGQIRKEDPGTVLHTFTNSFTDLLAALGDKSMDTAMEMLTSWTKTLKEWTAYVQDPANAQAIKDWESRAVAFGAVVIGLGSIVVGVTMLSGALEVFVVGGAIMGALEYLTGEKGLKALAVGIQALFDAFEKIPGWVTDHNPLNLINPTETLDERNRRAQAAVNGTTPDLTDHRDRNRSLRMLPPSGGAPLPPGVAPDGGLGALLNGLPVAPLPAPGPGGPLPPMSPEQLNKLLNNMNAGLPAAIAAPVIVHHSSYVPPARNDNTVQVTNVMYLDGDVVHQSVTKRQVRAATLPDSSYSGFDGSRTARTAGSPMPI